MHIVFPYLALEKQLNSLPTSIQLPLDASRLGLPTRIHAVHEAIQVESLPKLDISLRFVWLKRFAVELHPLQIKDGFGKKPGMDSDTYL